MVRHGATQKGYQAHSENHVKTAHLFRGRAPRKDGKPATEPPACYCLWDNLAEEYVIKARKGYGSQGVAAKALWHSAGAAKNAAMMIIRREFHAMTAAARKEGAELPERVIRFDDQTRYEVHKMELRRVEE